MFFAKKPLTSASGPQPGEIDISHRILHHRVVNLQATMRQEGKRVAVPKAWKLVSFRAGQVTEIASNVVWFDLDAQGGPAYPDGYSVYSAEGKKPFESKEMISGPALTLETDRLLNREE